MYRSATKHNENRYSVISASGYNAFLREFKRTVRVDIGFYDNQSVAEAAPSVSLWIT